MRSVCLKIDSLQEELQNLRRLNEENHVKLSKDLDSKSQVVAQLSEEVTAVARKTNRSHFLKLLRVRHIRAKASSTTGGEAQVDRSGSRQKQGRDGAQVSTQDRRHGGADGKAQGRLAVHTLTLPI